MSAIAFQLYTGIFFIANSTSSFFHISFYSRKHFEGLQCNEKLRERSFEISLIKIAFLWMLQHQSAIAFCLVSILDFLSEERKLFQELLCIVQRRRAVNDSLCRVGSVLLL